MNPLIQFRTTVLLPLIALLLACFGFAPSTHALLPPPPPDGGYPGNNTAEGTNALFNLTTGNNNTAAGVAALFLNTTGVQNTARFARCTAELNSAQASSIAPLANAVFRRRGSLLAPSTVPATPRRLAANPIEPPIKPTPTMVRVSIRITTEGARGIVRVRWHYRDAARAA